MQVYEFESDDGSVIQRRYNAIDVPDEVVEAGVTYRVRFWVPRVEPGVPQPAIIKGRPHLAHSAPRQWTPGLAERYDKWGPHGVAAIDSVEDQRRFEKALKEINPRSDWKYDP
jgi:hypothetical protein